ncbi:MAG: hypothetical protein FWH57_05000 [Oscillospiraceae bacterium]|nr:hypothetical protein [Oscillospiraceae bacterium]
MYKVKIADISELSEEVTKVEIEFINPETANATMIARKSTSKITVSGRIMLDAEKRLMLDSTKAIANWSLLKPGQDDVYKTVSIEITNEGETIAYEFSNAFVISYHEHFDEQGSSFKLVMAPVWPVEAVLNGGAGDKTQSVKAVVGSQHMEQETLNEELPESTNDTSVEDNTKKLTEYFTFTPDLTFNTQDWNSTTYQPITNCYAYAFNMLVNPLTGQKFPVGGMQPGMLSKQYNINTQNDARNYSSTYLAGTKESNAALVDLVTADMNAVGMSFLPYDSGMTGGYKVAFAVDPRTPPDYHWYRQEADGTYSHKQGQMPVSQSVGYYEDKNGKVQFNSDTITDPQKDAASVGYSSFIGYFYVKPSEK